MKYSKYLIISILICSSLVNWACDDRVPDSASSTNSTLVITSLQSIADDSGESVGEVVSGSSSMLIVATLKNESGDPLKGKVISFTKRTSDGDFSNGATETTDENGVVKNTFKPNSSEEAVDNVTTPGENESYFITVNYLTNLTAKAYFNVYQEQADVWPYIMNVVSDVASIKLDNGATTAQINTTLINKRGDKLTNVILSFSSDKGSIDSEATTDSVGAVTLTFQDNGTQEDIGLANIVCTIIHPKFGSISDSAQVTIGTDNGLSLQILPVTYDEAGSTVVVGEDISGNVSYTRLIATVTDTSGNVISGIPITFSATSSNDSVGTVTYVNEVSNTNGQVVAEFDDGGNVYKDNPGTPNYEGVTIFAKFGDKTTDPENFNVYAVDDVWPYNLFVNTDTDVISLDGGVTVANINTRLLNKLGNPVGNAQINYTASLGFIAATGFTDSVGVDSVLFTDLGNPEDVGVSDIMSTFSHPGFDGILIQDSLQVYIEDPSFQSCAYIEIPSSSPDNIVVREGGGTESSTISAKIYDDNDNLINYPTLVRFKLQPILDECYLEEVGVTDTSVYTVNGIATVSVNSGTEPGPVRVEVSTDCDLDGSVDLEANAVPLIIEAGPPRYIYTDWNPQNTQTPGGGLYQTQLSAIVKDRYHNPVEDSTYIYWTIDPVLPDTIIEAEVEGVSFTFNEGDIDDPANAIQGIAWTTVSYYPEAIGQAGRITTYTFGDDINLDGIYGDSIGTTLDQGEAVLGFVPGQVSLMASATYHDFTLNGEPAFIQVTAIVIDYYGNPVMDAPIAFNGTGINDFYEVQYENVDWADEGVNGAGAGDGCFTWRDYGLDDDPSTPDWGNYNDNHDSFDTTGNGEWDSQEISEFFNDYGLDGVPNTSDEGEGNGEWDGYSMIGCEPIVKTDEDGFARIIVEFDQALCTLANEDDETGICTWDDFTASISATLLIPEITTSEPLDILLVRSPALCD